MEDRISNKSVWNNKQRQEIEFLNLFCEHMLAFYSANTKFIPYNVTIDFFMKQKKTRAQQLMKSSVVNAFKLIRFLYNPSTTSDKTWWKFLLNYRKFARFFQFSPRLYSFFIKLSAISHFQIATFLY